MSEERPEWFNKIVDRIWNDYLILTMQPPPESESIALEKEKFMIATGIELPATGPVSGDQGAGAFFLMNAYNVHDDGNIRNRLQSASDLVYERIAAQKEGRKSREMQLVNLTNMLSLFIINHEDLPARS